jgi:hypothetical protein
VQAVVTPLARCDIAYDEASAIVFDGPGRREVAADIHFSAQSSLNTSMVAVVGLMQVGVAADGVGKHMVVERAPGLAVQQRDDDEDFDQHSCPQSCGTCASHPYFKGTIAPLGRNFCASRNLPRNDLGIASNFAPLAAFNSN